MDREEIKSIKSMVENQENLNGSLGISVKVDKTGAEIKDVLTSHLVKSILSKNDSFRVLENIAEQVGELPQGKLDEWELRGMRSKLTTIPFKYDYNQLYKGETINNLEAKYNAKLYEYIDLSVDCLLIKAVIDNISNGQVYQLNLQNASKLGLE